MPASETTLSSPVEGETASVLFFPPDLPRRVGRWFPTRIDIGRVVDPPTTSPPSPSTSPFSRPGMITLALVAIYAAIQLLMPLRHHVYAGNVAWTEEGHRYSWRMKLRSKSGDIWFLATNPVSIVTIEVDPHHYLTPRQVGKMASQPDMIVQFSRYLAGELENDVHGEVGIRAVTMVSLNDRAPQPLIDPNVDLTAVELSLAPARQPDPVRRAT